MIILGIFSLFFHVSQSLDMLVRSTVYVGTFFTIVMENLELVLIKIA